MICYGSAVLDQGLGNQTKSPQSCPDTLTVAAEVTLQVGSHRRSLSDTHPYGNSGGPLSALTYYVSDDRPTPIDLLTFDDDTAPMKCRLRLKTQTAPGRLERAQRRVGLDSYRHRGVRWERERVRLTEAARVGAE